MLKRKSKFLTVVLAMAMSVSVFAGCGSNANNGNNNNAGNNSSVTDNKNNDSSNSASDDKKSDGKAEKQVITYNLGAEPKTIDPGTNAAVDGATVIVNAFDGLTRLNDSDQPVAAVAEKWDVSEDGLHYTMYLRKDVKWTDGKPVTAKDFEYAWKRALAPETASEYAYQLYYLKNGAEYNTGEITDKDQVGVVAKDDYTLEIELQYPTSYFLSLLAFPTYMPIRQDAVEANPDNWFRKADTYLSNGPFMLKEWRPKDVMVFVKNPDYWNADDITMEQINYKMIDQATSSLAAFKTGQMDFIEAPPQQEIPGLLADGTAQIIPYLGTYYYNFNVSDKVDTVSPEGAKVLKDLRVRKALTYAINRKEIVENVAKGGQMPATSFVPTAIPDENGNDFTQKEYYPAEGDVAKAKELLAEAGYPDGKGFPTLTMLYNTSENHQNIAMAVQDMWRKNLGINVELQNQEWKVFQSTRTSKDYEIARGGWIGDYVDPMTFLDMFISDSGLNDPGFKNADYDKFIEEAKISADQAVRMKAMHNAEDILMEEMPIIPIYYYTNVVCIKDYVKNVHKSPLGMVYFDHTYIAEH